MRLLCFCKTIHKHFVNVNSHSKIYEDLTDKWHSGKIIQVDVLATASKKKIVHSPSLSQT